ncbi:unnamed protein product [Phaedon cochleariae]|uniref:Uncharacterized protein n=1 Tax=Phaedon cochleariae TaxID=80249 RepID=A0A9N9SAK0_PHACE|nr:unnamed protein product [Phaedon cochleariae]
MPLSDGAGVTLLDLHKILQNLDAKSDKTQETLCEIKSELLAANNKIVSLEEENTKLKERISQLDSRSRRNNILVFGLQSATPLEGLYQFRDTLEIDLDLKDINNIYFFPAKTNKEKVLKLELLSYLKKIEILKNLHKLKNKNWYVVDDLSPEDQSINKALRQHLNRAKQNGIQATIRRNHLIVNNSKFSLEDLELDPSITKEKPVSSATPSVADETNSRRKPPHRAAKGFN